MNVYKAYRFIIFIAFALGISYLSLIYGMKLVIDSLKENEMTPNSGGSYSIRCPISISGLANKKLTVSKDQDFEISIEVLNDGKWLGRYKEEIERFRKFYKKYLHLDASMEWATESSMLVKHLFMINPYKFIEKDQTSGFDRLFDKYYFFKEFCPNADLDNCLNVFVGMAENTGGVCSAKLNISGDFTIHPEKSEINISLRPNEPKTISWVLTPRSAGYKIVQLMENGDKIKSFDVIVTPIRFIPNWLAQWGAIFFAFLGPIATLPWILDRMRKRSDKRKRIGGGP